MVTKIHKNILVVIIFILAVALSFVAGQHVNAPFIKLVDEGKKSIDSIGCYGDINLFGSDILHCYSPPITKVFKFSNKLTCRSIENHSINGTAGLLPNQKDFIQSYSNSYNSEFFLNISPSSITVSPNEIFSANSFKVLKSDDDSIYGLNIVERKLTLGEKSLKTGTDYNYIFIVKSTGLGASLAHSSPSKEINHAMGMIDLIYFQCK